MPQALKPPCLTQVGRILFSHFQPSSLWGSKNWVPQYKDVEVGKFREQNLLNRLQMVQFERPSLRIRFIHLGLSHFEVCVVWHPRFVSIVEDLKTPTPAGLPADCTAH